MTKLFGLMSCVFAIVAASYAQSAPVRFVASGEFDTPAGSIINGGDSFSISLVFDDAAANVSTDPLNEGLYTLLPQLPSFAVIGSERFFLGPTAILVSNNDAGFDRINFGINGEGQTIGGETISQFGIFLQGNNQTFDSVGLDAIGSDFAFAGFNVTLAGIGQTASGEFSSLSSSPLTPIPLPQSGVLLLLTLAVFGTWNRIVPRKRRC